jgi:hypothetical protein
MLFSVEIFTSNFNKLCEIFLGYVEESIYKLRKNKVYYGSVYLKVRIARNLVKISNFEF